MKSPLWILAGLFFTINIYAQPNIQILKADFEGDTRNNAVGVSGQTKEYIGLRYRASTTVKDFWTYTPYCSMLDTLGVIYGQDSNLCNGGEFNYSIDTVPGAVYYTWAVPANTFIMAGQGSSTIKLSIQNNFTGGNISVVANNRYNTSRPSIKALSVIPAVPSVISGPSIVSAHQTGIVFSVKKERANYDWSLIPLDAVITSGWGTHKITVNWRSSNGYVGVSASNACGLSDTRGKVVALSGKRSITSLPGTINSYFNIYPNPTKNTCLVVFNYRQQVHYTLSVTNTNGKTLYIKQGISFIGLNMITIDMSSFPVGMYLVNLIDFENGNHVEKLHKE